MTKHRCKFDIQDELGLTRYTGFSPWSPAKMVQGGFLVMVSIEDSYDYWYCEDSQGLDNLREYYQIEFQTDPPMASLVMRGTHYQGHHDLDWTSKE